MKSIISRLEEVIDNAGDSIGRDGEYITDNLFGILEDLKIKLKQEEK